MPRQTFLSIQNTAAIAALAGKKKSERSGKRHLDSAAGKAHEIALGLLARHDTI